MNRTEKYTNLVTFFWRLFVSSGKGFKSCDRGLMDHIRSDPAVHQALQPFSLPTDCVRLTFLYIKMEEKGYLTIDFTISPEKNFNKKWKNLGKLSNNARRRQNYFTDFRIVRPEIKYKVICLQKLFRKFVYIRNTLWEGWRLYTSA